MNRHWLRHWLRRICNSAVWSISICNALLLPLPTSAQPDTLRLTLDECITMARRQSVDAAVALGELRSAYYDYLGLDGALHVTQKLWPTGGTLSVESSLDYLHQTGGGMGSSNQFMSLPVAVTLSQPLFGVNRLKWDRRIEPLRYREAQARFLTATEQVAMQAINLYFGLLMAGEQVNIARQNLQTAERPSAAWAPSARTTCCKCASMCSPHAAP